MTVGESLSNGLTNASEELTELLSESGASGELNELMAELGITDISELNELLNELGITGELDRLDPSELLNALGKLSGNVA